MPKYLTVEEAASMFRVKRQTIYKWICEKRIPSISLGGRTLFDEADLIAWTEACKRQQISHVL